MQWNEASRFEFDGKSMETETTTWSELPNGKKATVEQILAPEERNSKEQDYENILGSEHGKKRKIIKVYQVH